MINLNKDSTIMPLLTTWDLITVMATINCVRYVSMDVRLIKKIVGTADISIVFYKTSSIFLLSLVTTVY